MSDQEAIDALVARFYDLFTNRNSRTPNLHDIQALFIEEGMIIKMIGDLPEICNLRAFMEPRVALLTNGTLVDFEEHETSAETTIFQNIAQRVSHYTKSGKMNGAPYGGTGIKVMQFVKVRGRWLISATAWFDY